MMYDKNRYADLYLSLKAEVERGYCCAECDDSTFTPSELEVQALWHAGLLGTEGETMRHGKVRILDFGEWNRSTGPDFQRAEIEINGVRMRGDIEIDPTAQDWERHGHGANPNYTKVVLHVVVHQPPAGWYTRNEQHIDIPILHLKQHVLAKAMGKGRPPAAESAGLCKEPLSEMSIEQILRLLQAAAAYRVQCKQQRFRKIADAVGQQQAWYEAFAETLGYKINKLPMQMLARRAPLNSLGKIPEAILFGTAGFLTAVLPQGVDEQTRQYHRSVWDAWWAEREKYELSNGRELPWKFAPLRPANHPHRRVAALARIAARWNDIRKKLQAESAQELRRLLTSLEHPYWSYRYSLPSLSSAKPMALIGSERVKDFLANHVYALDEAPFAWQTYLSQKNANISHRVQQTATALFGNREDITSLLPLMYVQQALLQIDTDFCSTNSCRDCLFPEQLCQWHMS